MTGNSINKIKFLIFHDRNQDPTIESWITTDYNESYRQALGYCKFNDNLVKHSLDTLFSKKGYNITTIRRNEIIRPLTITEYLTLSHKLKKCKFKINKKKNEYKSI